MSGSLLRWFNALKHKRRKKEELHQILSDYFTEDINLDEEMAMELELAQKEFEDLRIKHEE